MKVSSSLWIVLIELILIENVRKDSLNIFLNCFISCSWRSTKVDTKLYLYYAQRVQPQIVAVHESIEPQHVYHLPPCGSYHTEIILHFLWEARKRPLKWSRKLKLCTVPNFTEGDSSSTTTCLVNPIMALSEKMLSILYMLNDQYPTTALSSPQLVNPPICNKTQSSDFKILNDEFVIYIFSLVLF